LIRLITGGVRYSGSYRFIFGKQLLIDDGGAIFMTMRVFFMLLIFAIGFSGYSAAAHAFMQGDCDPVSMSKMADNGMDMSDCPGHSGNKDVKKDVEPSKTSKAKCLDCTHCCMNHAALQKNEAMVFLTISNVSVSSFEVGQARDNLLSLLRPPRTLV